MGCRRQAWDSISLGLSCTERARAQSQQTGDNPAEERTLQLHRRGLRGVASMVPLPIGVSSGHTTTYGNHNPVPEAFTAPCQAAPCPCRGDSWEKGFFFPDTKTARTSQQEAAGLL